LSQAKTRKQSLTVDHNTGVLLAYTTGTFVLSTLAYYLNSVGTHTSLLDTVLTWIAGLGSAFTFLGSIYTGIIRVTKNHLKGIMVDPIISAIDRVGNAINTTAYTQYCMAEKKTEEQEIKGCVLEFSKAKESVEKAVAEMKRRASTL